MNSTQRGTRWGALVRVAAMTIAACSDGDDDTAPTTTAAGARNTPVTVPALGGGNTGGGTGAAEGASAGGSQLGFRLSEGTPVSEAAEPLAVAEGTPLTDEEVAAVIDRLPEWAVPGSDVADFNRPVESLRPPLVSDTLEVPFPLAPGAPSVPDVVASSPLEVLRFQPDGDVGLAPFIALTFNEPMIELATLEQLDLADVPVEVTPDITASAASEGRWRWIGIRRLRFEVTPSGDAADGTWDIAAGATVRVRLTMVADARRAHVALIDPLPAGFEAVNPALATSLTVPGEDSSESYSPSWFWQWLEHQNLRDDRVEAFTRYLPGGTYEYTYVARATTPGEFVVPSTRAEEIFAPEVFGRGSSATVVVTDHR